MAYPISKEALDLFTTPYRQVVDISFYGLSENLKLTEKDIVLGGLSVNRYCVSGSKIEIGSVVAAEIELKLNNSDGRFNNVQFEGAEMYVRVGTKKWDAKRWENAVYHYVPFGYFTVDEAPRKLEVITLAALDRMVLFDKPVDIGLLPFPMTVSNLLSRICDICNVTLGTNVTTLPNHDYVIQTAPTMEDLTYRQLLSWVAELTGTCGFIDWDGHLILKWYSSTDTVIDLKNRFSSDLEENTVEITGVRVVTEEETYLVGDDGYAFNIEGNELIQHDYRAVARALYNVLGGFTYTPFSATIKPMPHLYPLDVITFLDKTGGEHTTIITDYTFSLNTSTSIEGKGETVTKKGYASANPLTKRESVIINAIRKKTDNKIDSKMQSILAFNELITNSLGVYSTVVTQPDGSQKYYMHDAPTLEESTSIYTHNAGGFAYTNSGWNGGNPVWETGFTKDGSVIAKRIIADGVSADVITSGLLQSSDGNSYWNLSSGSFVLRNGKYEATNIKTYDALSYSQADLDRIQAIALGAEVASDDDLELYDFFGRGYITSVNALIVQKMMLGLGDYIVMQRITVGASQGNAIKIERRAFYDSDNDDPEIPWVTVFEAGAGGLRLNPKNASHPCESMVDYPIEVGTAGDWSYRKWAGGTAECWYLGDVNYGEHDPAGAGIADFVVVYKDIDLPFTFQSAPVATCSIKWVTSEWVQAETGTTSIRVRRICNNNSFNSSPVAETSIYVIGQWR